MKLGPATKTMKKGRKRSSDHERKEEKGGGGGGWREGQRGEGGLDLKTRKRKKRQARRSPEGISPRCCKKVAKRQAVRNGTAAGERGGHARLRGL